MAAWLVPQDNPLQIVVAVVICLILIGAVLLALPSCRVWSEHPPMALTASVHVNAPESPSAPGPSNFGADRAGTAAVPWVCALLLDAGAPEVAGAGLHLTGFDRPDLVGDVEARLPAG